MSYDVKFRQMIVSSSKTNCQITKIDTRKARIQESVYIFFTTAFLCFLTLYVVQSNSVGNMFKKASHV